MVPSTKVLCTILIVFLASTPGLIAEAVSITLQQVKMKRKLTFINVVEEWHLLWTHIS